MGPAHQLCLLDCHLNSELQFLHHSHARILIYLLLLLFLGFSRDYDPLGGPEVLGDMGWDPKCRPPKSSCLGEGGASWGRSILRRNDLVQVQREARERKEL